TKNTGATCIYYHVVMNRVVGQSKYSYSRTASFFDEVVITISTCASANANATALGPFILCCVIFNYVVVNHSTFWCTTYLNSIPSGITDNVFINLYILNDVRQPRTTWRFFSTVR